MQWLFLMSPVAHDSASTLLQKIVGMAYPFMDLILVTAVVRLAIGAGKRAPSLYLMGAAAFALFLTDTVYTYISVQGLVYDQSGFLEAGWGMFYLLWGAAALHPSMRHLADRAPDQETRLTRARLILLGAASLIPQPFGRSSCSARLRPTCGSSRSRRPSCSSWSWPGWPAWSADRSSPPPREGASQRRCRARHGDEPGEHLRGDVAGRSRAGRRRGRPGCWSRPRPTTPTSSRWSPRPGEPSASRAPYPCRSRKKRDRLQSHHSYEVPIEEAELASSLGMPPDSAFVLNAPLFMKEELRVCSWWPDRRASRERSGTPWRLCPRRSPWRSTARSRPRSCSSGRARRDSPRWSRTPRTWSWSSRPTPRSDTSALRSNACSATRPASWRTKLTVLIQPEDRAGAAVPHVRRA